MIYSEKDVEKLFKKYAKGLIKKYGNKALTDLQVTDMAKLKLKGKYLGTFPQDKINLNKSGYMIINTDLDGKPGIHWVALYITKKTVYIYDSFARDNKTLLKILTNQINKKKLNVVNSDRSDAEQFGDSEVCGVLSVAWLYVIKDIGIKNAIKI